MAAFLSSFGVQVRITFGAWSGTLGMPSGWAQRTCMESVFAEGLRFTACEALEQYQCVRVRTMRVERR